MSEKAHILSYKTLATILGILYFLTAVTVAVSRLDLGALNVWVALLVAATKSSFVLWFFMHMKYEKPILLWSFTATLFFLAIMIGFVFFDIAFR
jgi:cytochrome c oxidase subunit 4